jgi:phospholipid/cholesterol/gamma-HCH transport system permease protein
MRETSGTKIKKSVALALHRLGAPVHEQVATMIDANILFYRCLWFLPNLKAWRWNEIAQAVSQMGIHSLPSVALTTAVAGTVVTHEIALHMDMALHTVSMIPGFSGQFILRELGVAIPSMILVSKVGAATTAEVGTMKVTEQIDALKLLGIDPLSYLVFPRFVAAVVSGACLTLISVSITLACAVAVAVLHYNFSTLEFLNALRHFVGPKDLLCALVKGIVYGAVIPITSCAYGLRCRGGAEGVGNATTNSVVTSTTAIILYDFLLTYIFTLIL